MFRTLKQYGLVLAAPLTVLAVLAGLGLQAQPPGPRGEGPKGPAAFGPVETVQGTAREFTQAPKGELDGLMLADGTWVHWPPHLAERFRGIVERGDRVRASGRRETDPEGRSKLEIATLTNFRTGTTRRNEDVALPAGRDFAADEGRPGTVSGVVDVLTLAPKGEADGALLEDATWIHWPPHLADQFTAVVRKGDRVKAVGRWETGPKGDIKLEIQTVTNLRTGKVGTNDDLPPPVRVGLARADDVERRLQVLEDRLDMLLQELSRVKHRR